MTRLDGLDSRAAQLLKDLLEKGHTGDDALRSALPDQQGTRDR